MNESLVNN